MDEFEIGMMLALVFVGENVLALLWVTVVLLGGLPVGYGVYVALSLIGFSALKWLRASLQDERGVGK